LSPFRLATMVLGLPELLSAVAATARLGVVAFQVPLEAAMRAKPRGQ